MSDRIKDKTAAERALTEYAYEHRFKAITEDDVAWGKIKLTGSGVHAKETLGV